MKRALQNIWLWVVSLFALAACDVHEFPEEQLDNVQFLLHLNFNTETPLYKEVVYTRSGDADTKAAPTHDIRYTINAYRTDGTRSTSRKADATFVFTKSDIANLNYTAQIELPEGTYDFQVWADYVDQKSSSDKYYDTRDFAEIILANKDPHAGSTDYRDGFRGYASATINTPDYYKGSTANSIKNQATVEMKRPMGKFKFISTDVEVFLTNMVEKMKEQAKQTGASSGFDGDEAYEELLSSIVMGDYYVKFKYNAFMPCAYNMFTDKPADSWSGVSFKSTMSVDADMNMTMGYDYIFVNGSETKLSISLEVYNKEGELLSSTHPIEVPVVRSKLTVVKGDFLTSKATGGVGIDPGYDGDDYNIEIF